jgi:uncharacterized protein
MIATEKHSLEAVLRVGEVTAVEGQKIVVRVDKNKNSSDLFYEGEVLKNVSVNSFIEIRKGFLSLVGRVEGEKIDVDPVLDNAQEYRNRNKNRRFLTLSLVGFINHQGQFTGGLRELPLIGNEAYLLTNDKLAQVHNLVQDENNSIKIARNDHDDLEIALPINGLFNSHIAVFGNTGSGKSNTTAALYKALFEKLETVANNQSKFVFIDFNGEYTRDDCLTRNKKVYNLSTRDDAGDKLPFGYTDFLDIEILSIIASATEQTQKPFIKRTLAYYERVRSGEDDTSHFKNAVKQQIKSILSLTDKKTAYLLMDYLKAFLPEEDQNGNAFNPWTGLEWHNTLNYIFMGNPSNGQISESSIESTSLYSHVDRFSFSSPTCHLSDFIHFMYFQLIYDILKNRAQNDHVAPVINRLVSKRDDIKKIFISNENAINSIWSCHSIVVISLDKVNLEMKKTIPLLLCKKLYSEHKQPERGGSSLTFIIDEAHNILSTESFREAESWRDYRLETFEEIIKEGRKFGVFVTISSQRPSDISETITSQAHNYFIHRLINQKDLAMISKAVSYIDKITESSIPVLPTGTCIFSGIATQLPLKLKIDRLNDECQPHSSTFAFNIAGDTFIPPVSEPASPVSGNDDDIPF